MKNVGTTVGIPADIEIATLAELTTLTDEQIDQVSGGDAELIGRVGVCPCASGVDLAILNRYQNIINPAINSQVQIDAALGGTGTR